MARELRNADITHVSYVDKAANKRKFFLTKSAGAPTFEKTVKILTKADDAEKLVYGVVYEPDIEDTQGDFMSASEIEKSAHAFLAKHRNIDEQHDFEDGAGELVESYVVQADFTVGTETITKGSWVIVTRATDEIWDSIQKGDVTGYSMGGKAETVEKAEDGMLMRLAKAMGKIMKGEVQDRFYNEAAYRDLWASKNIFDDVFYNEVWNSVPDIARIQDAARDYADLLNQLASSNTSSVLKAVEVEKAGKKISAARLEQIQTAHDTLGKIITDVSTTSDEEEIDVTKEELQLVIKEALAPVVAQVEALEKAAGATPDEVVEPVVMTDEAKTELIKSFKDVLKEELAPVNAKIETLEKARGIQKSEGDDTTQEPVKKSVWAGLL